MITAEHLYERPGIPTETHSQLGEYSNLTSLPSRPPNIYLYSLEKTDGQRTIVHVGDIDIGGPEIVLMEGPCSLENERQIWETAEIAHAAGARVLRGGAFKPRTSPYSFQGMGLEGLRIQRQAADYYGMKVITEATGESNVYIVAMYADIIQMGARNAQNFELLGITGQIAAEKRKAVLYKRGLSMSIKEWLLGAEYLLATGCTDVILCERGTVMLDGNVALDISGIRSVRTQTHLPIIADPTHATQLRDQVLVGAKLAINAGADGLLLETHKKPDEAKSDGHRALTPDMLFALSHHIHNNTPEGRYFNAPDICLKTE